MEINSQVSSAVHFRVSSFYTIFKKLCCLVFERTFCQRDRPYRAAFCKADNHFLTQITVQRNLIVGIYRMRITMMVDRGPKRAQRLDHCNSCLADFLTTCSHYPKQVDLHLTCCLLLCMCRFFASFHRKTSRYFFKM